MGERCDWLRTQKQNCVSLVIIDFEERIIYKHTKRKTKWYLYSYYIFVL